MMFQFKQFSQINLHLHQLLHQFHQSSPNRQDENLKFQLFQLNLILLLLTLQLLPTDSPIVTTDPPIVPTEPHIVSPPVASSCRRKTPANAQLKRGKRVFINDGITTTLGNNIHTIPNKRRNLVTQRIVPDGNGYGKYYPPKQAHLSSTQIISNHAVQIPSIFPNTNQTYFDPLQKFACLVDPKVSHYDSVHLISIPKSINSIPNDQYYDEWIKAAQTEFESL